MKRNVFKSLDLRLNNRSLKLNEEGTANVTSITKNGENTLTMGLISHRTRRFTGYAIKNGEIIATEAHKEFPVGQVGDGQKKMIFGTLINFNQRNQKLTTPSQQNIIRVVGWYPEKGTVVHLIVTMMVKENQVSVKTHLKYAQATVDKTGKKLDCPSFEPGLTEFINQNLVNEYELDQLNQTTTDVSSNFENLEMTEVAKGLPNDIAMVTETLDYLTTEFCHAITNKGKVAIRLETLTNKAGQTFTLKKGNLIEYAAVEKVAYKNNYFPQAWINNLPQQEAIDAVLL